MSRIVLKVGGAVAGEAATLALALAQSHEVCVVHGAGPQISAELEHRLRRLRRDRAADLYDDAAHVR